jgi:hypothetical protein
MDNSTQRDEMLMQYLDGLMNAGQKAAFEKQLATDEQLRSELEGLQIARHSVRSYGRKQQVAAIHQTMMKELDQSAPVKHINPARRMVRRIVAVAASIVFIVLVWQGLEFYNLSSLKIFDENYIQYSPDNMRDVQTTVSPAIQAYIDKDYKKVIELTENSTSPKDKLLAAHAQLALNNAGAAVSLFKTAIEQSKMEKNAELQDAAEYNLILSYIRNKDYDLALELMNEVEGNPAHLYHDKMTGKLFRQVKMLKWR